MPGSFVPMDEMEMLFVSGGVDPARVNHATINASQADCDLAYSYTLGALSVITAFIPGVGTALSTALGTLGVAYTISTASR